MDYIIISIKGPGLKIFAAIIAVIALGFGVYSTFFMSAGYETTTATIVSIEEDPDYIPDPNTENDVQYITTAKYTVDGKEYTTKLDSYSPDYKVGGTVEIKYDPKDPSKMTSGFGYDSGIEFDEYNFNVATKTADNTFKRTLIELLKKHDVSKLRARPQGVNQSVVT